MMKSLVRLYDRATHEEREPHATVLTGGSEDVEICGLPALRAVADVAHCQRDPGNGQIRSGSPSVTINGHKAVGEGHNLICGAYFIPSQDSVLMSVDTVSAVPCGCDPPTENVWKEKAFAFAEKQAGELCKAFEGAPDDIAAMAAIGGIVDEFNRTGFINVGENLWDMRTGWGIQRSIDRQIERDQEARALGTVNNSYVNVGQGNVQVLTAYQMYQKDPSKFPMIDASGGRGGVLAQLTDYLKQLDGTVAVAKMYMDHARTDFEACGIELSNYSARDQAGLLMSYYKQGPRFLKRYAEKALEALDEDPPRIHHISSGEGCSLCLNWDALVDALAKGSCPAAARVATL